MGKKRLYLFIPCMLITCLMAACSGANAKSRYQYEIPANLVDGWATASLQEVDLDSRKLTRMMEDIQDGGFENVHSLLVVKDGRLAFEEYYHGRNPESIAYVASMTKSVTSILIGIAIDQGLIQGVDQPLAELLPAYAEMINKDPLIQKLQLWHILSMTSGIEWDEGTFPFGDSRNDATAMENSPDAVRFIMNRPIIREPGKRFQYCACNSMLLSAILEEAAGMTAAQFGKLTLFEPLGIRQYRWSSYADGRTHTDGGLSLRPRDMAKIGQLMLSGGQWDGKQIVSGNWIAESTLVRTTVGMGIRYGYQWWREKKPILLESVEPYFAAGYGGQLIDIYPDQNMVIVVTGDTANHDENASRIMFLQRTYLIPATHAAMISRVFLWSWYLLTAGGLVFIILEIVRGKLRGFGWTVAWLWFGFLLGPLGLAAYLLSWRNLQTMKSPGWKALGIASFLTIGNISGIVLLSIYQHYLFPEGSVALLVIPGSFLVSWLACLAPLVTFTKGITYWKSLPRTLLIAIISSCLTLIGVLPILVLISFRWPNFGLANSIFWFVMTICSLAGMVMVYPFSYWMAHRHPEFWPAQKDSSLDIKPARIH